LGGMLVCEFVNRRGCCITKECDVYSVGTSRFKLFSSSSALDDVAILITRVKD
jgi:hypothetical protein